MTTFKVYLIRGEKKNVYQVEIPHKETVDNAVILNRFLRGFDRRTMRIPYKIWVNYARREQIKYTIEELKE